MFHRKPTVWKSKPLRKSCAWDTSVEWAVKIAPGWEIPLTGTCFPLLLSIFGSFSAFYCLKDFKVHPFLPAWSDVEATENWLLLDSTFQLEAPFSLYEKVKINILGYAWEITFMYWSCFCAANKGRITKLKDTRYKCLIRWLQNWKESLRKSISLLVLLVLKGLFLSLRA